MLKAKCMGILAVMCVLTGATALQAQSCRIGYLPSTVGQALTQAWKAGMEGALKGKANVSVQSLDAQMKAEIQVSMMDDHELWAEKDGKKSAVKTVSTWDTRTEFECELKVK